MESFTCAPVTRRRLDPLSAHISRLLNKIQEKENLRDSQTSLIQTQIKVSVCLSHTCSVWDNKRNVRIYRRSYNNASPRRGQNSRDCLLIPQKPEITSYFASSQAQHRMSIFGCTSWLSWLSSQRILVREPSSLNQTSGDSTTVALNATHPLPVCGASHKTLNKSRRFDIRKVLHRMFVENCNCRFFCLCKLSLGIPGFLILAQNSFVPQNWGTSRLVWLRSRQKLE